MFTHAYAQQSCTAGRASFILGQHPFRTGLLTIGMPGSDHGIPDWSPTIADLLKEQGYATAQFGKNHLGDQDKHLPTAHGFDEFFGNLYHLNAEEEPESYYYPKDPEFRKKFGPRGVLKATADGKIEDTDPMTRKRMETADKEFLAAAGEPDVVGKLKQGYTANGKQWKVHLDGYDMGPYLRGETEKGPRNTIYYFAATGHLNAVRWGDFKAHFATQSGAINTAIRQEPAWPLVVNLKADPYEKGALESEFYVDWYAKNTMWTFVPIQQKVQEFLASLEGYPFQEGSSLSAAGINYSSLKIQKVLKSLQKGGSK